MKVSEFATLLFEIEFNAHVAHLQTTSLSQHLSLKDLYQGIVELRDRFIEAHQGQNSIIKGYKSIEIKEGLDPVKYLEDVCDKIDEFHGSLKEPYLQAIVEDIQEFIYSKKYLLKFLK